MFFWKIKRNFLLVRLWNLRYYSLRSQLYGVVRFLKKIWPLHLFFKKNMSYYFFCCDLFYHLRLFECVLKFYIFEEIFLFFLKVNDVIYLWTEIVYSLSNIVNESWGQEIQKIMHDRIYYQFFIHGTWTPPT